MTDREREAFWRLAKSLPSTHELIRQHSKMAMQDPRNIVQQPDEHPILQQMLASLEDSFLGKEDSRQELSYTFSF